MRPALDSVAYWLIDFYIAATLLLALVALALRVITQPTRRLALHWGALVGLVLLAVFSLVPGWPRIDVVNVARAIPGDAEPTHRLISQVSTNPEDSESGEAAPDSSTPSSSLAGVQPSSQSGRRSPLVAKAPFHPARSSLTSVAVEREKAAAAALAESHGFLRELANRDLGPARMMALAIFAIGSVLTAFRVIHGVIAARRVRLTASRAPRRVVAELQKLAGKSRCPELLVSWSHPVPIATGTFWPRILLPRQFAQRERPDDCRSVLAHELAHIQNGDLWLLALDRWLLPLFWMHPLYMRLRRSIRDDQELLADTYAARHSSRADYADMLVRWARRLVAEKRARQLAAVGVWDRPALLADRISRLLQQNPRLELCCPRAWRMGSLLSLSMLPILLSTATMRPDVARESNYVATASSPALNVASRSKGSLCCHSACRPDPESEERIRYSMEQPAIAQIHRLGGSVKKEPIGSKSFVTEVNMVFHYTVDGHRVDNTTFTADSLPYIAKFRHLRALSLAGGQITDEGLEKLTPLKELEEVVLRDARGVSCGGVCELVKLPQLRRLELTNAPIGDAAFAHLTSIQTLEELSVQGSRLSVRAVDIASRMPHLKSLSLELPNRIVGREALSSLRALPDLKRLSLRCSNIPNDAVLELGTLKDLRYLSLGDSRVSPSALASLRRSLPNLNVQSNHQTLRENWPDSSFDFRDEFVADEVLSRVREFARCVKEARLRAALMMTDRFQDAQFKVFSLRIYPSLTNVNWKLAFVDSNAALAISSEFSNHYGATLVFTCRLRRVTGNWKIEEIGATSVREGVEKTVTRFAESHPNARPTDEWIAVPANVR